MFDFQITLQKKSIFRYFMCNQFEYFSQLKFYKITEGLLGTFRDCSQQFVTFILFSIILQSIDQHIQFKSHLHFTTKTKKANDIQFIKQRELANCKL